MSAPTTVASSPSQAASPWYRYWQSQDHQARFDGRSRLDIRNLARMVESFNETMLLRRCLQPPRPLHLLEVGCATGEMFRYLRARAPWARYEGIDVSAPAIARAQQKYPAIRCGQVEPGVPFSESLAALRFSPHPDVVFARDVLQHQVKPRSLLAELIKTAAEAVILRCRTRDAGATEWDPERSCQYHYGGWMPYIVININELMEAIRAHAPEAEVVIMRHHMILGGRHNRFVPKSLYDAEAGGAETAVGIFQAAATPGRIRIEDHADRTSTLTWDYRLRSAAAQLWQAAFSRNRRGEFHA